MLLALDARGVFANAEYRSLCLCRQIPEHLSVVSALVVEIQTPNGVTEVATGLAG